MGQRQLSSVSVSTVAVGSASMITMGAERGTLGGTARREPPALARAALAGRPPERGRLGEERPEMPKRWTLPITALRETPPSNLAIWPALKPACHF